MTGLFSCGNCVNCGKDAWRFQQRLTREVAEFRCFTCAAVVPVKFNDRDYARYFKGEDWQ